MRYFEYLILTAVLATAGDLTFSAGQLSLTGLGNPIDQPSVQEWRKDSYAAGTASVKTGNLAGFTLEAGAKYSMEIHTPDAAVKKRLYYFWAGDSAPTAAAIVDQFVADVNADEYVGITAADAGNSITLTLDDAADGDFFVRFYKNDVNAGITPSVGTPYVAPQGTPALVAAATGASSVSDTGQFTRYEIDWLIPTTHAEVGNSKPGRLVTTAFFIDETDADAGALIAAIDDVLDGTHTPASDFLGRPQG